MTTGPTAGFPLPLRNALAELTIAALDRADARVALAWLAGSTSDPAPPDPRAALAARHLVEADGTLLDVHRPHVDRVRARSQAYSANSTPASTAYSWFARTRNTNAMGRSCTSQPRASASRRGTTARAMSTMRKNDATWYSALTAYAACSAGYPARPHAAD